MPPQPPIAPIPNENEDRLLPPGHKSGAGALVGIIVILILLVVGALYFWGALLNARNKQQVQLPLIPGSESTTTIIATTTISTTTIR